MILLIQNHELVCICFFALKIAMMQVDFISVFFPASNFPTVKIRYSRISAIINICAHNLPSFFYQEKFNPIIKLTL